MSRFVIILLAFFLALSAVCGVEQIIGAGEESKRLEGDPSLVNVDSQRVQQVVVLPGVQPTAAIEAGDEPIEMNEEPAEAEGEGEGEGEGEEESDADGEIGNYLMEEDEAEDNEGWEEDSEEDDSEDDSEEDEYLADDSEGESELQDEYVEDDAEESEDDDDDMFNLEDDQPLVNVDAREVRQVVVATPKHKKLDKLDLTDDDWLKDISDKEESQSEESS